MPKVCPKEIQKMQQSFIWDKTNDTKYMHRMKWEKIAKPKSTGRLRIRNLDTMNKAYLLKLGWKLKNGDISFWCQVMKGKHNIHNNMIDCVKVKVNDSRL